MKMEALLSMQRVLPYAIDVHSTPLCECSLWRGLRTVIAGARVVLVSVALAETRQVVRYLQAFAPVAEPHQTACECETFSFGFRSHKAA